MMYVSATLKMGGETCKGYLYKNVEKSKWFQKASFYKRFIVIDSSLSYVRVQEF
jgi:hypothetical protein